MKTIKMENLFNVSEIEIIYKNKVKAKDRQKIMSSKDSENVFRSIYDANKIEYKEMFYCMYLNRANNILGVLLISEGGTSGTVCDPKNIFQGALKLNASALILSHNHPSGNLKPSEVDKVMTKKIIQGGKLLDINVLDHIIIVPDTGYYSFADNGIMN